MVFPRTLVLGWSFAVLAALCVPALAGPASDRNAKRPVVVELYTSQGCSSCPPADALLGQLSARKDVLAISLPVTYWDMLGWRDTLASEANTQRQKEYAKQLGRGGIYTPQMIIDGASDVIGSREQTVQAAIAARASDMQNVAVQVGGDKQQVHISVGPGTVHGGREATIWMLEILPQATVRIGDGENGGHTVTYHNVVRGIRSVGTWKGEPVTLNLPRSETAPPHRGIAVLVQQGGYGRVLGAALLD
jgi:hypothetical protein